MAKKTNQEETIVDVQEIYTKTELFVDKNRNVLLGVAGVLVAAIAGYFIWSYLQGSKNDEAAQAIWKADIYYGVDSLDLALKGDAQYAGFLDVANEFGGTKTGNRAKYQAGLIYRDKGEYQLALDYFLDASIDSDEINAQRLGNIGDMYVQNGDIEKAVAYFEKAANEVENAQLTPVYLMKSAMAYMELDNNSSAAKNLKRIVDEFPASAEKTKAERYIASLPL